MKSYINFRQNVLEQKNTCLNETKSVLEEIENKKELNIFLAVNNEESLVSAEESDKRFANGNPRKLEGMLIGAKDNISMIRVPTTCGSKMLEHYKPIYDATVLKRVKAEGGIIIGKTNMDEFAMGSSNETSYFGHCKNPINTEYVPGGSSGGSAACVAANFAHTALGSDTGGSIRQPASFCGTVGFKPTYGRISRYGLIAFASSLDHVGTFSANIDDTALLFDVISGIDEFDSTSANLPPTNTFEKINDPLPSKFKVGLLPNFLLEKCADDVLNVYSKQITNLKNMGAEFVVLNFDFIDICVPTYIVITTSEASTNLARFDGIRYGHSIINNSNLGNSLTNISIEDLIAKNRSEGMGDEVIRRILVGTYFLSSKNHDVYYKAKKIRSLIKKSFIQAFEKVDLFFLPTSTTTAFKLNEKEADPVSMYLSDFFTTAASLAGMPAISLPLGFGNNNLPVGMQLQTNLWEEEKLFRFSKCLMNLN